MTYIYTLDILRTAVNLGGGSLNTRRGPVSSPSAEISILVAVAYTMSRWLVRLVVSLKGCKKCALLRNGPTASSIPAL